MEQNQKKKVSEERINEKHEIQRDKARSLGVEDKEEK